MSHTNFFDILRSLETVFRYKFAKYYKYYPINGCHTWIICQTTYTYFQYECPDCCSVIRRMPVTMSHTNSGHSGKMVQNHFSMCSFTKTYPNKILRPILTLGCHIPLGMGSPMGCQRTDLRAVSIICLTT